MKIPKGQEVRVQCRIPAQAAEMDAPLLFEPGMEGSGPEGIAWRDCLVGVERGPYRRVAIPVKNVTDRDIWLPGQMVMGTLEPVKRAMPLPINAEGDKAVINEVQAGGKMESENAEEWVPPVDLSHLEGGERQTVMQMLKEEAGAFSRGKDDIGVIDSLQLHLSLKDTVPVQQNYTSIPRSLYKEVKEYIEDLVCRGWVEKSKSPYSSPVVCVHKTDGSLRMCCDYRKLNQKTIPDRQPIPRIQDILDGLKGNSWFSVLDQGRAYHQGVMHPESRPLTAFICPWGLYQWNRIPFGLSNAPAAFQCCMEEVLGELRLKGFDMCSIFGRHFGL